MVNSEKLLGSVIKCDTSEPDSHQVGNAFFDFFTTAFKNLCKPFPIIFSGISDPFHSIFECIVMSRVFNLASLVLIYGCALFPSQISLRAFVLINMSS